MHQGRPYGLHVIGGKLTERDESFVSVTARRFSNLKDLSSIDSSRMVYDLPDGGYVVIQDMGGNFRIIAHKTSEVALIAIDGMATDYIPMLYSGVILSATPFESDGVPIRLTETTRRRLIDYDDRASLPPKEVELHRFRIEYDNKFKYFEPQYKGIRTFTQYHKLRATWYSGAMSEVMQIIGGYGRQDSDDLPDKAIERKRFKLPNRFSKSVRAHVANQRLPAYTGIPEFKGKYKYDYSHRLTNAVSFDSAGKPWLLQINARGVYAMPLPIIPATTAPAFISYLREVVDDELIHIVERFGGLPSGETFPIGDDFQAWYRAGVIIKVCDTTEFYRHSPFYLACGWSFNNKGDEGFNSGWSFDSRGMRYAYGFKMKLKLGMAVDNGWTLNAKKINDPQDSAMLSRYLVKLFSQLAGSGHRERAIKYKIMRTPAHILMVHARANTGDINYWENLIADPIANHKGSLSQVSSGPMYWGSKNPLSFGALKFPEFTGQGCESFDMTMPDYNGPPVKSDTVVFGCYVNDQLTTIKFFLDTNTYKAETEGNFEEEMIVGSWSELKTESNSMILGYLYTSDFDDRGAFSDNTQITNIVGTDLGYGNPSFLTPPLLFTQGTLTRDRYYKHKITETSIGGSFMEVAVCVPAFTRDCMLYAYRNETTSTNYSERVIRYSVADPTSYSVWTYDPVFHASGLRGRGEPRPTIGEFVYANFDPEWDYNPKPNSWFADSGNWYGVDPNSFKDVSAICAPYTTRGAPDAGTAGGVRIGGEAPQINEYTIKNYIGKEQAGKVSVSITIAGQVLISENLPQEFYFAFSPQFSAGQPIYFYRDATWIASGTQKYSSTSELKGNGLRSYWGSTKLADHKSAHCFIGVINE